jgi:tetratricopeptide (TPR) repeat protein
MIHQQQKGLFMSLFQLILLMIALVIFYLFFKKLFSEEYPKRGVDYEAKTSQEQIGGINRPDKTFSTAPESAPNRVDELIGIADGAVSDGDMLEAKKALQSAIILAPQSSEVLSRYGYVANQMHDYSEAKEQYDKVVRLSPEDDMAHAALANVLHKLGEEEEAIKHHEQSIALDGDYAPHYFNYANTLHDLGRNSEALEHYQKAYSLDSELAAAKEMVEQLGGEK